MSATKKTRKKRRAEAELTPNVELIAALKFDKYEASAVATMEQLTELFVDCGVHLKPVPKWSRSGTLFWCKYYDDRGKQVGRVNIKQGKPTLWVVGGATPVVVERLRDTYRHMVWRADICFDSHGGLAEYNELKAALERVKATDKRLGGVPIEDPDHPERGSRYYLGQKESPGSVCLYRKGLQPGYRNKGLDDWNRLEGRVDIPEQHREAASSMEPIQILGLNLTLRKVVAEVLGVELTRVGTTPKLGSKALNTYWYVRNKLARSLGAAGVEMGGTDKVLEGLGFAIDGERWVCQRQADHVLNRTGGIDVHAVWPWFKTMVARPERRQRNDEPLPAITMLTGFDDEDVSVVHPLVSMPEVFNSVRIRGGNPPFCIAAMNSWTPYKTFEARESKINVVGTMQ